MFSIIVPVYNVEKYLDKCLASILEQTYNDFECIIIYNIPITVDTRNSVVPII